MGEAIEMARRHAGSEGFVVVSFGTRTEPYIHQACVDCESVSFEFSPEDDRFPQDLLERYRSYPNARNLSIAPDFISYELPLTCPSLIAGFLADYLAYFHPEIADDELCIELLPLFEGTDGR